MKRRSFLQKSSFVSVPLLLNGLSLSAVNRSKVFATLNDDSDNILVLVQMNGGNDGLNTIIPLDKYDILNTVRSNVMIPESDVLKLQDDRGLHPTMTGIRNLYDQAKVAIVQDAGYPNQNRSHFRSTDIWTTGSPADEFWTTGWLGRYLESYYADYPVGYPNESCPDPFAISLGSSVSETCQGSSSNFSLALTDPFSIAPLSEPLSDDVLDTCFGKELDYLKTSIAQSNAYAGVISNAAELGNNIVQYPDDNDLAQQLKTIALLIAGGLRTRVYVANIGGFDTHSSQVDPTDTKVGRHADLLTELSNAIAVFQNDLEALGIEEKVLTMTFSEFGRRIRSNESFGTDHGTAAPLMLFGTCINPGIFGESPEIPDQPSVQDGVPMQFDFRSIYGSVLMDWFGVEEQEVKALLFEDFNYIPVINPCVVSSSNNTALEVSSFNTYIFPNPCKDWATIYFNSEGEKIRISLFDALGQELRMITNQFIPRGDHQIKINTSELSAGNYFYQITGPFKNKTKGFIKMA